jgi:alpha-mannosidase
LLPHAGGWRQAQVDRRAYELNIPALAAEIAVDTPAPQSGLPETFSLLEVDSHNLIVEALKQAETGEDLILRTFDSHGCHSKTLFTFSGKLNNAAETDLLEENPQALEITGRGSFVSDYAPYEIKTHRLNFLR